MLKLEHYYNYCTNHSRPNLISDIYPAESLSVAELNKSQGKKILFTFRHLFPHYSGFGRANCRQLFASGQHLAYLCGLTVRMLTWELVSRDAVTPERVNSGLV